ncbi:dnaJ domain-containing protein [Phthorimaea operculella]|nr:dnaJ domain-containing protein [Phthorimaea operculella]
MENQKKLVDYYKVLECDKNATDEELKKNYQRLVLASHPDKQKVDCASFHLIHKAYSILRDPALRKHYDAELSCQDHDAILIYEKLKVSDMTYHPQYQVYTYYCRCGGTYMMEEADADKQLIIGCDECSFSIHVN